MADRPRRTPRLPTPETLRRQVVLEEHDLSPDGSFAVVSRRVVEGEHYTSSLWLVPIPPKGPGRPTPRRLTWSPVRDTRPLISPDGRRVAFLREMPADDDAPASLRVLDLGGGEPRTLPTGDLSVREYAWSPDGRRIAFTARTGPQRFIVGPVPKTGEPRARRVTTMDWRYDETGYVDRLRQVHVIQAAEDGQPRCLTSVSGGVSDIAWRSDGQAVAFTADPRDDADRHPRTSIWEVPL
ncbi:MAG: hypothetical protein MUQ32_17150, partial [Chloroflexi bacterium]|nr:hypothetical protein [Chloroflexota bacterium]